MAKAPPSFDFFYNDWMGGTYHLSHVARACYLDLIIYQFQNGQIPDRKLAMMNVCRVADQGQWDAIWLEIADKFEPLDDTRRGNQKIDEVRQKSIKRWRANKENGSKGGRPRKNPSVSVGLTQTKPNGKEEGEGTTSTTKSVHTSNTNSSIEGTKKKTVGFNPPTLEEVRDEADRLGYEDFLVEKFMDFYESKGWLIGKAKMKSWPAAMRRAWNDGWCKPSGQATRPKRKIKWGDALS